MKTIKSIILSFSMFSMNSYAETRDSRFVSIPACYQQLTTSELEQEVEKRSLNGTLPFTMGLELIRRWSMQ